MKQKLLINMDRELITFPLRKNQHFRIRSASREKFMSTLSKSK
jgi:hypothetical protein